MAVILAIANQKGGVGKTTTAVTLGALLARGGSRVLLVDLDAQGNVADSLGLESGRELTRLLSPDIDEWGTVLARENLWVIRSDKTAVGLKQTLAGVSFREYVLLRALAGHLEDYEVVLIDCAPSVDVLHVAALVAADYLLVPTKLEQLAVKGVRDMLESVKDLQRMQASKVKLAGVIPTFYERQTRETLAQLENLVKAFTHLVLPPVPVDTQVREANRAGQTILEFDPRSRCLVGIQIRGEMVGGYEAVVRRLEEVVL